MLTTDECAAIWGAHHRIGLRELATAPDYRIEGLRHRQGSGGDAHRTSAVRGNQVAVTWWAPTVIRGPGPCHRGCQTTPTSRGCIIMCNPCRPDGHFLRFADSVPVRTASITLARLAAWAKQLDPAIVERIRGGLSLEQTHWLLVDLLGPPPKAAQPPAAADDTELTLFDIEVAA